MAIPLMALLSHCICVSIFTFCKIPKYINAAIADNNNAMVEFPVNKKTVFTNPSERKFSAITDSVMSITGSSAIIKLGKAPGKILLLCTGASKKPVSEELIFFNCLPSNGPAIITAGMAMQMPYNNVLPISALNAFIKTTGPGCGGKKQCVVLKDAAMGMAIYNSGSPVFFASMKTRGTSITNPAL